MARGIIGLGSLFGSLAVAGASLCWAVDNNLTRRVSALDPRALVVAKGVVAGAANVSLALAMGERLPHALPLCGALALGFVSYGLSLALFVSALQKLGAARTSAYASVAPFVGALLSIMVFGERPQWIFYPAAVAMAFGLWLHLSEHHEHPHRHGELVHSHPHYPDVDHRHDHESPARDRGSAARPSRATRGERRAAVGEVDRASHAMPSAPESLETLGLALRTEFCPLGSSGGDRRLRQPRHRGGASGFAVRRGSTRGLRCRCERSAYRRLGSTFYDSTVVSTVGVVPVR